MQADVDTHGIAALQAEGRVVGEGGGLGLRACLGLEAGEGLAQVLAVEVVTDVTAGLLLALGGLLLLAASALGLVVALEAEQAAHHVAHLPLPAVVLLVLGVPGLDPHAVVGPRVQVIAHTVALVRVRLEVLRRPAHLPHSRQSHRREGMGVSQLTSLVVRQPGCQ